MSTIKKARVGAFKTSVDKIVSAAENGYATKMLDATLPTETVLTFVNGTKTTEGNIEVNYKGKNPNDGEIRISSEGKIGLVLYENNQCISKTYNSSTLIVKEITKANCTLDNQIDTSRANAPVLSSGMTPIKWNGTTEVTTDSNDPEWYDYSKKKWANVKTKDGSYWVWIPRYGYQIPAASYHTSTAGTIDIKFLDNDTNKNQSDTPINTSGYDVNGTNTSNAYFLHPAFQYETSKYGYWVAKFEPTAAEGVATGRTDDGSCIATDNVTTKTIKITPNSTSWRCINNKNAYTASVDMKTKENIYGWNQSEVDTHMMTNYEWGAVAYLSNSIYGANQEIWNNSNNTYKTGCAGTGVNANNQSSCNEYNTTDGVKASTTHNITGIYDMSGGAWDRTMAKYGENLNSSGFTAAELSSIPANHLTRYEITPLLSNNGYDFNPNMYGDAMYEIASTGARHNGTDWVGNQTASWNGDTSYIPTTSNSWFARGAIFYHTSNAGAFAFNNSNAIPSSGYSFRPVVALNR